jgi:ribosomal protein L10
MSAKHRIERTDYVKDTLESQMKSAKTIIFFSGINTNRFIIQKERTLLGEKNLRLTKVNNVILRKILATTGLKLLKNNLNSCNLICTSRDVFNVNQLNELIKLKYENIVFGSVLVNNMYYTKERIERCIANATPLKPIALSIVLNKNIIAIYIAIQQFVYNKLLQLVSL